jgi:hypothetical protein
VPVAVQHHVADDQDPRLFKSGNKQVSSTFGELFQKSPMIAWPIMGLYRQVRPGYPHRVRRDLDIRRHEQQGPLFAAAGLRPARTPVFSRFRWPVQ